MPFGIPIWRTYEPAVKNCLGYFLFLLGAAALNYLPGVTDAEGRAFGIFALDIFDDSLHLASAAWALAAALLAQSASRFFLIVFGALYLGDGVFGFFTGYGYLDLAIFTNPSGGMAFTLFRVVANAPHILLGGVVLLTGLKLNRHEAALSATALLSSGPDHLARGTGWIC